MINQTFPQMLSILPALDSKGGSAPHGQKATQNNGHLTNYSCKPSAVETKDQAVNLPYKCHYTTTKSNYFLTNSSEEKHINVYNTTCLSAYVG